MRPQDVETGLTAEVLRSLMRYEAETGRFFALHTNNQFSTDRAMGGIGNHGYRVITVKGHRYLAHRLAWLWMTGEWPANRIDHKNMDRSDNRWENLREATDSQNKANGLAYRSSHLKIKGVRLHENGRYQVRLCIGNGKSRHLGMFNTAEEAAEAYRRAVTEQNGEFARP